LPNPRRIMPWPQTRLLTPGNRPLRLLPAVAGPVLCLLGTRARLPPHQRKTSKTRMTRRKLRVRTLRGQSRKGAQQRPRCWRWRPVVKRGRLVRSRPPPATRRLRHRAECSQDLLGPLEGDRQVECRQHMPRLSEEGGQVECRELPAPQAEVGQVECRDIPGRPLEDQERREDLPRPPDRRLRQRVE
jgi:hypothetical protein